MRIVLLGLMLVLLEETILEDNVDAVPSSDHVQ